MQNINRWLQNSVPPKSYKIQIAYVDTGEKPVMGKVSADDTYQYRDVSWMDMSFRFTNYSQANVYALKQYSPILYRITGSNDEPNHFQFDHYDGIQFPEMTPQLNKYLEIMVKAQRGRVGPSL